MSVFPILLGIDSENVHKNPNVSRYISFRSLSSQGRECRRERLGGRNTGHPVTLHPKREVHAHVRLTSSFSFSLSPWDGITHMSPSPDPPSQTGLEVCTLQDSRTC